MRPFVQSEIFKLHFQRLSHVPMWKVLPCVVGESESCFGASVRGGGVKSKAVAVQSRTNRCILDMF